MVHLRQLRIQSNWTLKQMSEQLGISIATLARIEASERKGKKYIMDERNISHIVGVLNTLFRQSYTASDLEAIELAPPRPGRPKKAKGETDARD